MKFKKVMSLVGATAVSLVGIAGLAATPALAGGNGAQKVPADQLTAYLATNYGYPYQGLYIFASPFVPAGTFPNVKVSGNCAAAAPWLFTDEFGLNFVSGNAVVYRPSDNFVFPFLPGGLNAEGTAQLIDLSTGADTGFVGSAHLWLGQNANAKGQFYAGETVSFTGTLNGSTISFTANPGEIHSAGGHSGGWGQQNLTCNIAG